jgi:hypothetical protein
MNTRFVLPAVLLLIPALGRAQALQLQLLGENINRNVQNDGAQSPELTLRVHNVANVANEPANRLTGYQLSLSLERVNGLGDLRFSSGTRPALADYVLGNQPNNGVVVQPAFPTAGPVFIFDDDQNATGVTFDNTQPDRKVIQLRFDSQNNAEGVFKIMATPGLGKTQWADATSSDREFSNAVFAGAVPLEVGRVTVTLLAGAAWGVDAPGNWGVPGNWIGAVPNGPGTVANFGPVITAPRTVTVDAPKTVGTINFNSADSYTIAGPGTLTLQSNGTATSAISVTAGTHTISAPLASASSTRMTVTTGARLTASNLRPTTMPYSKDGGGTLAVNNVRASNLQIDQGVLQVTARGTGNDPAGTSIVQSLAISPGAQLDLTNNSMIIDYTGPVGTLVSDTRLHLAGGRITSSSAGGFPSRKLGYGDNQVLFKLSFAGQSVDLTSVLIKYTFAGDCDLDGDVDVADLGALASAWQTSGPWTAGDFDYNGLVNVADLGILATNWQAGVGSPLGPESLQQALSSLGLPFVSIPEPASLVMMILGTIGLKCRLRLRNPAATATPMARLGVPFDRTIDSRDHMIWSDGATGIGWNPCASQVVRGRLVVVDSLDCTEQRLRLEPLENVSSTYSAPATHDDLGLPHLCSQGEARVCASNAV